MKSFKILVAFAVAVFCNVASADPYLTASAGSTKEGFVGIIGAGVVSNEWLRFEIDYRHFGKNTEKTGVSQPYPGYTQGYNPSPGQPWYTNPTCNGTPGRCPQQYQYTDTKVRGLGVSALFTASDTANDFLYMRVGAMYYKSSLTTYYLPQMGVSAVNTSGSGITPFVGLGANIWRFSFEVTNYGTFYPTTHNEKRDAFSTTISYKHPL